MGEKGILNKLQKALLPIGSFLSNEKHFASIQAGLMTTVALTLVGAIFQIIANPPITADIMQQGGLAAKIFGGWYHFAQANKPALMIPYQMTLGMFSVIAVFAIAYQLAKKYNINPLSNGIVALVMFLMVAAPATDYTLKDDTTITALNSTYLGGQGLFTAILAALLTVEVTRFCVKKKIVIKMPDVVPPSLQDSFNSLIPLLFNVTVLYGTNMILKATVGMIIPQAIMAALSAPLRAVNSVPGMLLLLLVASLLWCVGVHGGMIIMPLYIPILIQETTKNAALVAAGQHPVFSPIFLTGALMMIGGCGNTLGFSILCLKSKSEQLKAIGKVSIIPGIFGVNEPVLFGAPIVLNPILAIPFVFGTLIFTLIMWGAYGIGLLTPSYVVIMSALPIGVQSFMSAMTAFNFIFPFLMIPVMMLIWYPFFKVYEKQLVAQEQAVKTD